MSTSPANIRKPLAAGVLLVASWLWLRSGWLQAAVFVGISVGHWLVWSKGIWFRPRAGLGFRVRAGKLPDFNDMSVQHSMVTTGNSAALLATYETDPFLVPIGRALFLAPRCLMTALIIFSAHGIASKLALIAGWQVLSAHIGKMAASIELKLAQRRRDREAARLLRDVERGLGDLKPYYVYLRPFSITGKLRSEDPGTLVRAERHRFSSDLLSHSETGVWEEIQIPVWYSEIPLIGEFYGPDEKNPDWEAVFEQAYRGFGRFVALGRRAGLSGAGKIETDDARWQEVVETIAGTAAGFLVVPSTHPGTLWELHRLKETNFRGCVFFMPGPMPGLDYVKIWDGMKGELDGTIDIPPHPGIPCLFTRDSKGNTHIVPIVRQVDGYAGLIRFHTNAGNITRALARLIPISNHIAETEAERLSGSARDLIRRLDADKSLRLSEIDLFAEEVRSGMTHEFDESFRGRLQEWGRLRRVSAGYRAIYSGDNPEIINLHIDIEFDRNFHGTFNFAKIRNEWKLIGMELTESGEDASAREAAVGAIGKAATGLPS